MNTADVVIVGAGAVGCSIAAHLHRLFPGVSVVLLDSMHVGAGSTSRSTAAFRHQWSIPAHVAFSRYASGEYDRLTERGHPIGFRRNGYLFLYRDPTALEQAARRVSRQQGLGVPGVEVLDPDTLRTRVAPGPHFAPEGICGATWGPSDGFLDPLAVAQGYLQEARAGGTRYLPDSRMIGLLRDGSKGSAGGVRLQSGAVITAGAVILATGVWTSVVLAAEGLSLPIRPAKRYLYHSRPLRGLEVSGWPMTIAPSGAHLRPSEGNSLLMAWEARPRPLESALPWNRLWELQDTIEPGFGTAPSDYGIAVLEEMATLLPVLAETVALSRVTCGWYAVTPDHKAILGPDPRCPNLYHAAGFSGHGIMHAAATGLTLAELCLGAPTTLAPEEELDRHFGLTPLLEGRRREPAEDMVL